MQHIPDNYDLFEQHQAEEAEWLGKRPCCAKCGEKIADDYGYEIEPGEIWCLSCVEEWLDDQKVDIDEVIESEGGW